MSSNKFTIWVMWFIASFFYAYQYILRVIPSVMINDIMTRFNIDAALFGQFSGVYYLGYSLMHIPLGLMLDRIGPKKILPIFISLAILGTLPLVVSDFWVYPIIGRFLVGVGSSSAILGVFKIIRMSFAESRFAIMLSWSVTVGLLGAIYGGAPVNLLKDTFGYETMIWMLMAMGVALAVIAYFVIPHHREEGTRSSMWHDVKTVLANKKALAVCFFAGFMVGPLEGFADVWGNTYLQTAYGLDKNIAAGLPSFMFIGMAFGGPVLSFVATKLRNYLGVIFVCAIVMGICFIALLQGSLPTIALTALFFAIGMLCAYQILAIYVASTYVPSNVAGLMNAVANMIIMTFGWVFHTSIGSVIDAFSAREGYLPLDSVNALSYGIWVVPIGLFIGALGFGALMILARK